jgi:carbon monoxide dehydrogenase subunit G
LSRLARSRFVSWTARCRWTLEPAGAGTRLHFAGTGELRGPLRLLGPLVTGAVARQFRGHHRRLKRLVEERPRRDP